LDNVTENHSDSLGVTLHEVNAALARETRRRVRKRLIAMGALLAGQSIPHAAATAKTTPKRVECWLQRVRQSGFPSLLRDRRRRPCKRELTPAELHETRHAIKAALEGPLQHHVRTRLIAVDMVLSGHALEDAACRALVLPAAVKGWLRGITHHGIDSVLARWEGRHRLRPRQLEANPADLRDLAATEKKQPLRRQMLALALVAEGTSPHAAALAAAADYRAVRRRVRRFRNEGIAAFRDKERWTRKLAADQIEQLRAEVLKRPDVDYQQLREFIQARFGVHYSLDGFRLLLKRDLGMVRRAGRFIEVAAVRCLAAEIRAALAPPIADRRQPEANPIPVRIFGASGHNEP
jgi:transposase